MALRETDFFADELHPIDVVESLAEHHDWAFERLADDQIVMSVEGQWRNYSITLSWSSYDQTLRLICTFEMEPPEHKLPQIYEVLNRTNDLCWAGAFTYWHEQRLMVYRYGLILAGGQTAEPEQIDTMINVAVKTAERFYPAFQLVAWGDRGIDDAMQVAIAEAYGRA